SSLTDVFCRKFAAVFSGELYHTKASDKSQPFSHVFFTDQKTASELVPMQFFSTNMPDQISGKKTISSRHRI
ncbi:hypothetical protein, partial [Lacrimispora sp.]|uniref:hypothetical protein n=1 Tax=Lacrimispora sp. TaxID=2719234 RepID=UPI0028A58655